MRKHLRGHHANTKIHKHYTICILQPSVHTTQTTHVTITYAIHIKHTTQLHTHFTQKYTHTRVLLTQSAILTPHITYTLNDQLYTCITSTAQYKHIK